MMAVGKSNEAVRQRLKYLKAAKASLLQQTSLHNLRLMVGGFEKKEQAAYQKHIADLDNARLQAAWLAAKIAYDAAKAGLEAKEARESAQSKLKLGRK